MKILKKLYTLSFCLALSTILTAGANHKATFTEKDLFQSLTFQKNVPGLINDYNGLPIRYFVDCNGMTAFLTDEGPIYKTIRINEKDQKVLDKERAENRKGEKEEKELKGGKKIHLEINYVFEKWVGANPHPVIEEVAQKASGHYTYLAGSSEKDYHTIQTTACKKLIYHDVYPGIDVVYTLPEKGGMIYDFIVHPGADPNLIQMDYEGPVRNIALDHHGNIIIHAANGDIMEHTPSSYLANGQSIASSYKVDGNHVSFSLSNYDHNQTLTIDPWVSVLTQFTVRNLGADVDYDLAGNLYAYGAGSANFIDISYYQKVAKYDPSGNLIWVFNCNLPAINWSSALDSAALTVADNPLSNAKIDRLTGKVYVGKGFDPFYGTQVIRLDTSGNYDNFVSARNALFLEIWSFVQNCATGDIIAMGGGTNSNLNLTDINHSTGVATTNNFTAVPYGGVQLGQGSCQDIVSGALDSAQALYVVMASNSTSQVDNMIYKVNSTYTGTIWGPVSTGYVSFSEASNLPDFDNVNGSSNNFNALAVNSQYLYCYDGNHVSAFNTSTGAAVGTNLVITAGRRAKVLLHGGIAVDRCNNIYLGGKGQILVYSFNGSTYTAGTPISLGAAYANDSVFDVRYNPINNLLYATGTQFVGTFTPTPLAVCVQPLPFTDTIYSVHSSSAPCTLPEAIISVTPDNTFINGTFTYVWQDTLGNIQVTHGPGTAQSDTFHPATVGTYVVNIEYTENCSYGSHVERIVITGSDSLDVTPGPDTAICLGQSVVLNAIPCSAGGGSYRWSPGGATTASITVSPTTTTTYSVTYTPLSGTGPITDTIQVRVTNVVTLTVSDTSICNGQSATLSATPTIPGGTYSWTPGGATTQSITVSPATTSTYTVTYTTQHCGAATGSGTITIGPNAGPDQFVTCFPSNTTATMAATGTGTWSAQSGNPGTATIANPTSPTTTITGFVAGVYYFIWTNGIGCTDTAMVTVTAKPNAGPDQTLNCAVVPGGTVTMAATGTGTWTAQTGNPGTAAITSASSPTTTITTFSAAGTYHFIWTNGGCTDTAAVIISAGPNAGLDQFVACFPVNSSTIMAGTGTGTWSAQTGNPGTASITNPSSPTTSITAFSALGVYSFIWTNGSCADTAQVTVTANPNAGPDQTLSCVTLPGGSATMAAQGTGTWTARTGNPGTATITSATNPTTTITSFTSAGTYNFIWTSGTCSDTAAVIITTKPNAGPDQTVSCVAIPGGAATMAATGTGTWSADPANTGTATITSVSSPATTITSFSTAGSYNFIWTNGSCADTAIVTVTAKPDAGPDDTVCMNSIALLNAVGTGSWSALSSNPGTSSIFSSGTNTTDVAGFTVPGTYGYVWTVNGCTDTAHITVNAAPVIAPSAINITCNSATGIINATASGAAPFSYLWSSGSTTDSVHTVTSGALYTVTVTDNNHCTATASDSVGNSVVSVSIAAVTTNVSCYGYSDGRIVASVTPPGSYTYTWNTVGSTDSITGLIPGAYTVTATDPNGCSAVGGPYNVTGPTTVDSVSITPLDTTIVLGDTIQLNSNVMGTYPAITYSWTPTDGLSCTNCPSPVLVPTDFDTVKRQYQLTITYGNGCIASATDSIQAKPNDLSAIPDAFTPNGDGKNDAFKILATGVKDFKMNIYNRWGQQLFSTTDINQGWDGSYNGTQEPSEVYLFFYTITYHDGKVESREGTFNLFR